MCRYVWFFPSTNYVQPIILHQMAVLVAQDRINTALPSSPDISGKYMLSFPIRPLQKILAMFTPDMCMLFQSQIHIFISLNQFTTFSR